MDEIHRAEAVKTLEMTVNSAKLFIQTGDIDKPEVYNQISFKLGSTVDLAIAMNAVPSLSHLSQLLWIVNEVYKRKAKFPQPSLLSLMLPIKAACQTGWFRDENKNHLILMANQVTRGFSNLDRMNIEPAYAHLHVSNIISRFYPRMKVEHILTSFDVKAGYGTFVVDFQIFRHHHQDLWLLAARMDNMDTAACIATPLDVNFFVNRIEVPKRTKSDMGKGPQLPSNVTKMIKYGVNLLEVFGDFDGQYLIALAFMNLTSSPDPSQLQDYVHPVSDQLDSDCEVVEAASLISLNCPISQIRIKTPVKGHLCKHPQCFDYNGFMESNSVWPTWECPLCKTSVCNLDIRIDRAFLKILNEVANTVTSVILSDDGSWIFAATEKSQTTKTNKERVNRNKHTRDTTGKTTSKEASIEANEATCNSSPALHRSSGSESSLPAERPSTVTTPAVSLPHILQDSCVVQGSHDMLQMPVSVRRIRNHLNPVNLPINQPVNGSNGVSQNEDAPNTAEKALSIEANALHNPGGSTNRLTPEQPSTGITPAVSLPHILQDSCLQSKGSGSHDMLQMPASVQQIKNHLNNTNGPSNASQNEHVSNTAENALSIEANEALLLSSPALHNPGGSTNNLTLERTSTLWQSTETTSACSPHVSMDSSLQLQGSHDTVHTSAENRIKHHMNPVNSPTTQVSCALKNQLQNVHKADTTGNTTTSIQAGEALPNSSSALHNSGGSANSLTAEKPSTLRESTVTSAVPLPQVLVDSCLQSQGSDDMVNTPPSVQQIENPVNPVNLHTTRPSYGVSNAVQDDHTPDTTGNTISTEANKALPYSSSALHNSGGSANRSYAECPSTLRQSTVTTPAVPQVLKNSCLQSRGSYDNDKPPSVQQIRHHVDLPTTGPSCGVTNMSHAFPQSQLQQHQTHGATQARFGPSTTKKLRSSIYKAVELAPCTSTSLLSTPLASEHLKGGGEKRQYTLRGRGRTGVGTTKQAQCTTLGTPSATTSHQPIVALTSEQLMKGTPKLYKRRGRPRKEVTTASQGQSPTLVAPSATSSHSQQPMGPTSRQSQVTVGATMFTITPLSPITHPEPSVYGMPSGMMKGSLIGKKRETAQAEYLATPSQPLWTNEPWTRPTLTSTTLPMQQSKTTSENVSLKEWL